MLVQPNHRLVLCVALLFFAIFAKAQSGQLFMTHFEPEVEQYESQVFDLDQGELGQMFVASRGGILAFNGESWDFIHTKGTPYQLAYDSIRKTMWVASKNNIGFLQKEMNGRYSYQSIYAHKDGTANFNQISITAEVVIFYSDPLIISIDPDKKSISDAVIEDSYTRGWLSYQEQTYVLLPKEGFAKLNKGKLEPQSFVGFPESGRVLFSLPFENKVLTGWEDGSFLLFDGKTFTPWEFEGKEYCRENYLAAGVSLGSGSFAFSTLTGGVIIVNQKGKVSHYINYNSGLPDDEVLAIGLDNQGGLWIAHDYGLTRVDLTISLRNYAFYLGLTGNILSVNSFEKQLYVGTSDGLFYLDEVRDYDELEVIIKKREQSVTQQVAEQPQKSTASTTTNSSKKGFHLFNQKEPEKISEENTLNLKVKEETAQAEPEEKGKFNLFKKKNKKEEEAKVQLNVKAEPATTTPVAAPSFSTPAKSSPVSKNVEKNEVKKKIYKIRSIKHQYVKVQGLQAKCEIMKVHDGYLWVATNLGLYKIKNHKAELVIALRGIHDFYFEPQQKVLLLATVNGIKIVAKENDQWKERPDYSGVSLSVYSISAAKDGTFWFTSDNRIGTFRLVQGHMEDLRFSEIENPFSDVIKVHLINDTLRFFFSDMVYRLLPNSGDFEPDTHYNKIWKSGSRLVTDQQHLWRNQGKDWLLLSGATDDRMPYLRLFDRVNSLLLDDQNDLWVIAGNQTLIKIPPINDQERGSLPVFISSVKSLSGTPLKLKNLVLEYNENGLNFSFASPFYLAEKSIEYQYFIEGLMDDWSAWSVKSEVQVPFLPSGNYKLHVKARTVFGEVIESQSFEYKIKPPYYYTWWFYLIEATLFGILIYFSIMLNNSGQQTFFTKFVTIMTLMVIVELLQNIMRTNLTYDFLSSPVYDFAFDVVLATSIYPLERLLNNILVNKNLAKTKSLIKMMRKPEIKKHDPLQVK